MNNSLSEKEIDEIVIAQADDDSAGDQLIRVNRKNVFRLGIAKPYEIISQKDI
ncbi:MAG: hypothetical protein M3Q26_11240 [Acidobacteriota bacterium]|nr:hypothetical protein [Acidobacteriota bacterium]